MDWKENIDRIKEIYPGHFQIILDFATTQFLKFSLSDDYKYVWVCDHVVSNEQWEDHNLPLFDNKAHYKLQARNIKFEFVMPTRDFKEIMPNIGTGISLIQLNILPKHYLRTENITGKIRYDILKNECDYLFEIDIPSATDYGTIVSSKLEYLESLLASKELDWKNLP
jgi:hypothetical protein